MQELSMSLGLIALLFFVVAMAYSSVGLGGGSTYTALLLVLGFSTISIPLISLSLNLIVTSIASFNFIRYRHLSFKLLFPFIITSIPMAYLGGLLQIDKILFQWLLLVSLVVVVFRIYFWKASGSKFQMTVNQKFIVSLLVGGILGLLAGIVGIGGGIYLVPLILLLGLGTMKQAAACGAVFVWINSLTGIVSRLQYNHIELNEYWLLIIAVLCGGIIGSKIGAVKLSADKMEKILGAIVIVAIFLLARKILWA